MKSLRSRLSAQRKPFDGIEIGAVARQVMNLEVMPVESLGFVPTGVVNDEQSAFGVYCGYLLGEMIEAILEDIGVDSVENHLPRALQRRRGRGSPSTPHSSANHNSTVGSACQVRN